MDKTNGSRAGGWFEGAEPALRVMASLRLSAVSLVEFSGTSQGRPVTATYTPASDNEGWYHPAVFRVKVGVAGTLASRVRLTPRPPLARWLRVRPRRALLIGDPAFDHRFLLEGNPLAALSLFDHALRCRLLEALDAGSLALDGGCLVARRLDPGPAPVSEVNRLAELAIDLASESAETLDRLSSNSEREPIPAVRDGMKRALRDALEKDDLGATPPPSKLTRSGPSGGGFPVLSSLPARLLLLGALVGSGLALGLVALPFAVLWGPLPVVPTCVVLLFAWWWMLLRVLRGNAMYVSRRAREQLETYCALRDEFGGSESDRIKLLQAGLSFLELVRSCSLGCPGIATGLLADYYCDLARRSDALVDEDQPRFFAQALPRDQASAITVFSLVRSRLPGSDARPARS